MRDSSGVDVGKDKDLCNDCRMRKAGIEFIVGINVYLCPSCFAELHKPKEEIYDKN